MGREVSKYNCILIKVVIVFSLVCLCMYGIRGIYGFSLFPDEFGYWAVAAGILGYDFSEITSIGSFYSFGYSLILTPIIRFFSDSITAYRAAVIINMCLQVAAFFLLIKILDKLFKAADRLLKVLLAGMAVLYPSWVFYTQMTMSEALLFFMYTVVVYAMLCFLEKPSPIRGILLALATIYTYSVHMRTVGIVAAVAITVAISLFIRRDGAEADTYKPSNRFFSAALAIVFLFLGFLLCLHIKDLVIALLYSGGKENLTAINDYSGQTSKLKDLLSPKGVGRFLISMCGKILYLGCATLGTAYIGIYHLIKRTVKRDLSALFILLASLAQFLVMCIYLIASADPGAERFDLFLHGRYFDFVVPLLAVIGIYELVTCAGYIRKIVVSDIIIALGGIVSCLVAHRNLGYFTDPHGMLMIGMSYFLDEENVRPMQTIIANIVFSLLITCIIIVLVSFYKKKSNIYVLCVIHLFLIGLSYHACNHFIYIGQVYIYGDIQVADEIRDLRESGHEGDIVLLYEGGLEYIDTIQLRLRDEHIRVVYADDLTALADIRPDDLVLVDFESELNLELADRYDHSWESGHFDLYYNDAGGRN